MQPPGQLIRDARRRAGMTQATLAARIGTTQSAVSRWERGHDEPRLSTLAAVARATGRQLTVRLEPDDVDRAQLREQLALTPDERLTAVSNVSRLVSTARRLG